MSEIIHPDSEKGKLVRDISEIIHGDYYNFQEQAAAVMARIEKYQALKQYPEGPIGEEGNLCTIN